METKKHKCESCSMVGTFQKNIDGSMHYYCEHHKPDGAVSATNIKSKTELEKLVPLLTIFGLIAVLTFGTAYLQNNLSGMNLMMLMMAYFFFVFGVFKLGNLQEFADAYATYDIIAMRSRVYAYAFPFIELVLGFMYFNYLGGIYRDIFTFILMSVSAYGVWLALKKKDEIPCACLGMVFQVPMTKVTLFENLFMALMALYMVFDYLIMGNMAM